MADSKSFVGWRPVASISVSWSLRQLSLLYEQRAVDVVQFENRIGQRVCHAKRGRAKVRWRA